MTDQPSVAPATLPQLEELLRFAVEDLKPHLYRDGADVVTVLILGMFSRATTTVEAVVTLVKGGFGPQAMALNRSLGELMLDAKWAHQHQDTAAERTLKHYRWTRDRRRRAMERAPQVYGDLPSGDEIDAEERKASAKLFRNAAGSWTGLRVNERLEAITEPDEKGQFDEAFRMFTDANNAELHPTPASFTRLVRRQRHTDGREVYQFTMAREHLLGDLAVRNAWWCYIEILGLMHDILDLDKARLKAIADAAMAAFAAADPPPAD